MRADFAQLSRAAIKWTQVLRVFAEEFARPCARGAPFASNPTRLTVVSHDLDSVVAQAAAWKRAGLGVALATVLRTWGSSPRPAGSKLAVNEHGAFVGSVSGGCIEAAVIAEALEVMGGAPPRRVDYGVSDEAAWEVGLACGGKVEILIEAVET